MYGIYDATVIDNKDPQNQGRILVHIYRRDGKFNYSTEGHDWVPVLSPYGGNREMGMFMLPPLHASGFVIFEEGDPMKPVWLGSYPRIPTLQVDEEATRQAGVTIFETLPTVPPEMINDPSRIVIRTQYPGIKNPDITADENRIENLVVLDEDKLELTHVNQAQYSYSSTGIDSSYSRSYITLRDNSITLGVKNSNGEVHEISISASAITFRTHSGEYINLEGGGISVVGTPETKITIKSLGPIEINGKQLLVDAENIISGPIGDDGGGGAVTSDAICPYVGFPCMVGSSKTTIGG